MSYFDNYNAIRAAILLGIHAEGDEGNPLAPTVNTLTEDQIEWLASWLASEDIGKLPHARN